MLKKSTYASTKDPRTKIPSPETIFTINSKTGSSAYLSIFIILFSLNQIALLFCNNRNKNSIKSYYATRMLRKWLDRNSTQIIFNYLFKFKIFKVKGVLHKFL